MMQGNKCTRRLGKVYILGRIQYSILLASLHLVESPYLHKRLLNASNTKNHDTFKFGYQKLDAVLFGSHSCTVHIDYPRMCLNLIMLASQTCLILVLSQNKTIVKSMWDGRESVLVFFEGGLKLFEIISQTAFDRQRMSD